MIDPLFERERERELSEGVVVLALPPRAERLRGPINTGANEFDATFLADGATIVFARAMDFRTDRVTLFHASGTRAGYDAGTLLPPAVNGSGDTYGPMLDWSDRRHLLFAGQRGAAKGMDLYRIRYRIGRRA